MFQNGIAGWVNTNTPHKTTISRPEKLLMHFDRNRHCELCIHMVNANVQNTSKGLNRIYYNLDHHITFFT